MTATGKQQRRLSELLSSVPRSALVSSTDSTLAADEELLVPRLVARIAELEQQLYAAESEGGGITDAGSLLDRFGGLLRKAQQGLDAGIAYVVGDTEAQHAQLSQVTKEATAKALLITIKKLQALKADKQQLEDAAGSLQAELESAREALQQAQAAAAAAAEAEAAARAAAAEVEAAARAAAAEAEAATQSAAAADRQAAAEAAAAAVAAAAADRQAAAEAAGAAAAAVDAERQAAAKAAAAAAADRQALADVTAQLEALQLEARQAAAGTAAAQQAAAVLGEQVGQLQQQLAAAHAAAAELQGQLEASRQECELLQQRLVAAAEEAEGVVAEAEALRSARAALAQELNETKLRLERAQMVAEDFQRRFLQERLERRKVHEQLQVLRGNIRVCCRVRPLNPGAGDSKDSATCGVSFPYSGSLCIHANERRQQEFEFDAVFSGESSQEEVFDEVWPLIRSCADGYNVCILAYGQTGSGKTHTMMGPQHDPGLSVRALKALFDITAAEQADGQHRTISVSMLEIYNEACRDLLKTGPDALKPMDVSAMGAGQLAAGQERVPGLTWRPVSCVDDVLAVLTEGTGNRATSATALNAHSSRSHALLSVKLTDASGQSSVLHLVDLAGSERIAKSEVAGQQLKEAQAINKSLSALGDVISALQSKSGHIPYRNSKLTQVLQDSLCGSSKTLLVCCVSPEMASAQESISSLNFASRAAQVELGPVKKAQEAGPGAGARKAGAAGTGASSAGAAASKGKLGGSTPQSGSKPVRGAFREANA